MILDNTRFLLRKRTTTVYFWQVYGFECKGAWMDSNVNIESMYWRSRCWVTYCTGVTKNLFTLRRGEKWATGSEANTYRGANSGETSSSLPTRCPRLLRRENWQLTPFVYTNEMLAWRKHLCMSSTVDSGAASSTLPAKIGQVPVLGQSGGEKHAPIFFIL